MIDLLLGHQGGWDEVLLFAVPAGLAIWGLRWAERRARRRSAGQQDALALGSDDQGNVDAGADDRSPPASD